MLEEEVEGGVLRTVFAYCTWQLAATLQIDPTIMGPGNAHNALLLPLIPPSLWAGCGGCPGGRVSDGGEITVKYVTCWTCRQQ
jgi:hypothetical protein